MAGGNTGKHVAVMQPYFFPYAGYYRLLAAVDEFVIFDCVQFPRRGRVHRTEVMGPSGKPEWLTLPLARQAQNVLIRDLEFAPGARVEFDARLARYDWVESADGSAAEPIRDYLHSPMNSVIEYLCQGLQLVTQLLDLKVAITRSSSLAIDPDLRGQARVLAAAKATGASVYVNAPGGRDLYDPKKFAQEGIELVFLPPYQGPYRHFLQDLMVKSPSVLRQDLILRAGACHQP